MKVSIKGKNPKISKEETIEKINDLSILNIDYSLQVEEVIDEQASEAIE